MGSWTNQDGLVQKFGNDRALGAQVGVTSTGGTIKEIHAILEVARMDTTGGLIGGIPNNPIPLGAYILSAMLIVHETFAGASGTLDVGLANADGTYTNLDEDGLFAAVAVATLAQGTVLQGTGALVGIESDYSGGTDKDTLAVGYLSYDIDTTDFTAGKAEIIVKYVIPLAKSMTLPD